MKSTLPPFIVIEGLDGTGKSTLACTLARTLGMVSLSTPHESVRSFRAAADQAFPRKSPSSTLFYGACVLRAAEEVMESRASGRAVVLDRYWLSTRVYARVLGVELVLPEVEALLPIPTLTVYTTAPLEVRARRLAERGMTAHDRESLRPEADAELDRAYRALLNCPIAGPSLVLDTSERGVDALVAEVERAMKCILSQLSAA